MSGAVKLGTRGSALALWQAEWVRAALARHRIAAELVVIATRGDAEVDRPLHQLEGKGFFTHEIEEALLGGRIDVAVHSLKDLPTELADGLALGVVPERGNAAEALVTRDNGITSVAGLAAGAKVGTSSLRRVAQIRHLRPDLALEHAPSARAVAAERGLLAALGGGCQAPVAAYVGPRAPGPGSRLYGRVTALDGAVQLTASADIDERDPVAAGVAVAGLLQAQGASRLLGR